MDFKDENSKRISTFIERLAQVEFKQSQDYKALLAVQKQLEKIQLISERLIKLDLKLESFSHIINKLEDCDLEIEDSLDAVKKQVDANAASITEHMKEIQRLYQKLDSHYGDIGSKLIDLKETIQSNYLSNESFTKLQRNILWAVISFVGALAINLLIMKLTEK